MHQQIMTLEDVEPHTDTQRHDGKHLDEEIAKELTPRHSE